MSLVRSGIVNQWTSTVVAFDGHSLRCKGVANVTIKKGDSVVNLRVTVVHNMVGDFDAVIAMDVIQKLGGDSVCAPKIMSKILKTMLAKKPEVSQATSSYIDDIIVDVLFWD
ncbi:hypothetical protein ElyMa_004279400 [Elysia marginata]|uniref:Glyceraldehyde 3-phosphate dehydrogenase catalytic domain-containing protein n=1 Tax=Elysia marginata TaxID=1093978 RepID=A0AAV4GVZ3_9GAST|nr:hypothetical protein ElyMa_004279400 [Elysia marginata]